MESADPDWPFDIWIDALSYHYYYADRDEDTAMYGSFESSNGIDFFICDQDNFDLWTTGYTAQVYKIHHNIGSLEWEFIVPYDDTWYLMYDNTDSLLYQAHVVGTHRLDTTAPTISLSLDDGETYSGVEEIVVTASDDGFGVDSITLYINDVLTEFEYGSSLSYDWDTNQFANGEYTVKVEAEDEAGHIRTVEVDVSVYNFPNYLIPIILAGLAIPVVIGLAVFQQRKKKDQGYPQEPIVHDEFQSIDQAPVQTQRMAFCPSCGSPRQPPDARFCGNCGATYPDEK